MAEYMHQYEWEPKNISRPPLSRLVLLLKMNTIKNVRTMKPKLLPPSPSLLPVDQNRSLLLSLLAWVPCFIPKCIHVPLVKNIPHLFGKHLGCLVLILLIIQAKWKAEEVQLLKRSSCRRS